MSDIKKHRYLNTMNLGALLAKKMSAPWKPKVKSEDDVSNFGNYDDSFSEGTEVPKHEDPFLKDL